MSGWPFLDRIRAKQQRKRMGDYPPITFRVETKKGPLLDETGQIDSVTSRFEAQRMKTMALLIDDGHFGPCILESVAHDPITTI